jgi:hypothetical protein
LVKIRNLQFKKYPNPPDRKRQNEVNLGCIMVSDKTLHHPMGVKHKAYRYSILSTRHNKRFTHFSGKINCPWPVDAIIKSGSTHRQALSVTQEKSWLLPSEVIKTFILMQNEGSFHDDVRHLKDDVAFRTVLNLKKMPGATTLGDWLRRMGEQPQIEDAWIKVNRAILESTLHRCKWYLGRSQLTRQAA